MKNSSFFIYNKYKFTPFQQKVLIAILFKFFYAKKKPIYSFSINAKDVIADIESKMGFEDIQKETLALLHKVYEINEEKRFLQTSIFSSAEFIKGQGIINLTISPAFEPYLQSLKRNYTLLTIKNLMSFQSIYAIKMYLMLLEQNRSNAFKISILDLKTKFNIANQYKDYNTFKNRVILQAQKELHFTHLAFTFQEIKEGRKVKFFIIRILNLKHIELNKKQKELVRKLTQDLEITTYQAKEIVTLFLPEEIYQIIFNIKERYHTGQIKSSLGAYTLGVFSNLSK